MGKIGKIFLRDGGLGKIGNFSVNPRQKIPLFSILSILFKSCYPVENILKFSASSVPSAANILLSNP